MIFTPLIYLVVWLRSGSYVQGEMICLNGGFCGGNIFEFLRA